MVPAHWESLNAEDGQLRMENLQAENWQRWRKSLEAEDGEVWYGPNAFHVLPLSKYLGSQSLLRKTSPAAGRAQSRTAESDHTQASRTAEPEPHSKPKQTTNVVFF